MRFALLLMLMLVAAGPSFGQSVLSFDSNDRCKRAAGDSTTLEKTCRDIEHRATTAAGRMPVWTGLPSDVADEPRNARLHGNNSDDVAVGLCPPLHRMTRYGCL